MLCLSALVYGNALAVSNTKTSLSSCMVRGILPGHLEIFSMGAKYTSKLGLKLPVVHIRTHILALEPQNKIHRLSSLVSAHQGVVELDHVPSCSAAAPGAMHMGLGTSTKSTNGQHELSRQVPVFNIGYFNAHQQERYLKGWTLHPDNSKMCACKCADEGVLRSLQPLRQG